LLTINTHMGLFSTQGFLLEFQQPCHCGRKPWPRYFKDFRVWFVILTYWWPAILDILVTKSWTPETPSKCTWLALPSWSLHQEVQMSIFSKSSWNVWASISNDGIKPTEERIRSIKRAPPPVNKQELHSFLGINAKFLLSLSLVLHPLYMLLRKNHKWMWKAKQQKAFNAAKQLLFEQDTLALYDVQKPIKLYCDASPVGLGACLVHVIQDGLEQPVAYASRSLQPAEQKYVQIEHEALAIIFAVKCFHQYVYGWEFTLVTDHQLLWKILGLKEGVPPLAAARMQWWALLLSAYQYKIEFISGKSNKCADCMSRLPSFSKCDSAEKVHVIMAIDDLPVTAA